MRNTKSEKNSKFEFSNVSNFNDNIKKILQMPEIPSNLGVLNLCHLIFGFVSDFVIRNSNLDTGYAFQLGFV